MRAGEGQPRPPIAGQFPGVPSLLLTALYQPFGVSRKLVAQDGDVLDLPTDVEVGLQLPSNDPIVHLTQARPGEGAVEEASPRGSPP